MPFPSSAPVDQINAFHPDYKDNTDYWTKLRLLHAGGKRLQENAQLFLAKKPKELSDVYSERVHQFRYQNILETSLSWYQSSLFAKEPQIDRKGGDNAFWDAFMQNSNRAGRSYVDFARAMFMKLLLYRSTYVLVDKPRPDDDAPVESLGDEKDAGLDRPYLVRYDPQSVINWETDDFGNLDWVVLKSIEQYSAFLGEAEMVTTWYYFDRADYAIYELRESPDEFKAGGRSDREARLIADGPHALAGKNRVPVRRIDLPETMWLANRVYLQIVDHLNQYNTYGFALFMANLAMPVVTGQKDMSTLVLSEAGYIHLPDADAKVSWLEPAGTSFVHSANRLNSLVEEIHRSLHLQAQARSNAATPAMQSGLSKEMDMKPAHAVLNQFGDVVRAAMQNLLGDVADARKEKATFDVRGFQFETTPAIEKVEEAQAVVDLAINSPTLEREQDVAVAMTVLEDSNQQTKDKVAKEIRDNPTRRELADKKEADEAKVQKDQFSATLKQAAAATAAKAPPKFGA